MGLLVDTNILVDVLRLRNAEHERTASLFRALVPDRAPVCISVVTLAELLAGLRSSEAGAFRGLLRCMSLLPVDGEVAERAGGYLRQYGASHAVELGDALVAATASVQDLPLWTHNRKHFPLKDVTLWDPGADPCVPTTP